MSEECAVEIVGLTGRPNDTEPERIQWMLRLSRYPLKEWRTCWEREKEPPVGMPVPELHRDELVVECTKEDLEKSLGHYQEWVERANECCRQESEEEEESWYRRQANLEESRAIIEEAEEEIDL